MVARAVARVLRGPYCGIDPGLSGAISLLQVADRPYASKVWDIPTYILPRGGKNKREVDTHELASIMRELHAAGVVHVYLERVGSMPGQGVSSVFAFGKCFGIILGVLAAVGLPHTLVAPQTWKKKLSVPKAKNGARARASQLMPASAEFWPLVKHDGRAEASLIALYGARFT